MAVLMFCVASLRLMFPNELQASLKQYQDALEDANKVSGVPAMHGQ
jgi:hypothetical protein